MNLLENQNEVVLTDFLYFSNGNEKILADKCEIYKGYGLFLYKNGSLISHVQNQVDEVYLVDMGDSAHYYIKGEKHLATCYLVTKGKPLDTFQVGDKVALKGDHAFGLTYAYSKDNAIFDKFAEELDKEYLWEIVDIKEGIMAKIEQGEVVKFVSVSDIITVEKIKENSGFFTEE